MAPTNRLYYRDSYLTEFTARVLSARPVQDRTEVVLDRTAFYPEGGGQPGDLGLLGGVPVVGVVEREGEEVVHLLDGPAPSGEAVGQVDWERRFDHMQQHAGQHLLSQAFERLLAAPTVSFHMGASVSSIDVAASSPAPEQVASVEALANRVVFENRPILVHLLAPSELSRFNLRRSTERTEQVRVVEVRDFDAIPCGGTHCRSTAEAGPIKILRCDRRGSNTRVDFLCGWRALRDHGVKNEAMLRLAAALRVPDREVVEAVERLQRENTELGREAGRLRDRLLDYRAEELAREARPMGRVAVVATVLEGCTPDDLRHLATRLTAPAGRVAFLAASSDKTHLVFARSEDVPLDAGALLRQACAPLGGRGGGRPNLAQGGVPSPADARAALDAALEGLRSILTA